MALRRTGAILSPLLALAVAAVSLPWGAAVAAPDKKPAAGDSKKVCADSYDQAQKLRNQKAYRKAREQLLSCAQDACPAFIRSDCTTWLAEVDANSPSIVIEAKDPAGKDAMAVRVSVDGESLTDQLDGKSITLDPGAHKFHFEMAGAKPVDEAVIIREGEKNRAISIRFGSSNPAAPSPSASADVFPPKKSDEGGPPVFSYVLGGVGLVAIGTFAYLGLSGKSAQSTLESTCSPHCDPSQVSPIRTKFIAADISLGVGLAALGVASYFIFTNLGGTSPGPSAAVQLHLAPGGGGAALVGTF